jgi:hypothetical protein
MSRAVERVRGVDADLPVCGPSSIVIPPGAYRPHYPAISAFMDIGQGTGLATSSGLRPLLPPIVVGVMARADAGVDFSGTDWSWMESWVFIGILAVVFAGGWLIDRSRTNAMRPGGKDPESLPTYPLLSAAAGGLLFAGSLADGGETAWPGLVAGALLGFVGYLALARLFMRANRRLAAAGDPGTLMGLGRDALTVAVVVLVVLTNVVGYLVALAALVLLLSARRREGEKYEGLRILR